MSFEIERKFLVKNNGWKKSISTASIYRQGYLSTDKNTTVRVRTAGEKGFLTIKGLRTGIKRLEYEYEIPFDEAAQLLDLLCQKPLIEKIRYIVFSNGYKWEIDVFGKENQGLVIAEIELPDEETVIVLPEWTGPEVSEDSRYSNSSLVKNPYSKFHDKKMSIEE
ncbi:MAG: CYTH domain-containing protein [Ignavibacteria bacterium]